MACSGGGADEGPVWPDATTNLAHPLGEHPRLERPLAVLPRQVHATKAIGVPADGPTRAKLRPMSLTTYGSPATVPSAAVSSARLLRRAAPWRPMCRSSTPMNASVRSPSAARSRPTATPMALRGGRSTRRRRNARPVPGFGRRLEALIADEAAAAKVPLSGARRWFLPRWCGAHVRQADAPRYGGVWAICCGLPEFAAVPVDLLSGDGRPALVQWGTRDPIVATDQAEAVASLEAGGWKARAHATTWPTARRSR